MSTLSISFDPLRVDRARVHGWLSQEACWSIGLGRTVFERAVDHSLVASAYVGDEQVGFARVVADRATFAWLCDVFVAPLVRGQGIGTRLVASLVAHPDLQGLRRWGLRTRLDAGRWGTLSARFDRDARNDSTARDSGAASGADLLSVQWSRDAKRAGIAAEFQQRGLFHHW